MTPSEIIAKYKNGVPAEQDNPIIAKYQKQARFDAMSREQKEEFLNDKYRKEDSRTGLSENTYENVLAGVGSGMMNVVQGAGNMLGVVDDDTVMERKMRDAEGGLSDDTAGSVGQFVGEMAALAPLGVVGKGAQLASTGIKGTRFMLPTAKAVLGSRWAPVLAEGASAGAILANPNERERGAAIGATTAGLLKMATSGAGRIFNRGLVKRSEMADRFSDTIEETIGRRPHIPLRQAVSSKGGGLSDVTAGLHNITGMFPPGKAKLQNQANQLASDSYEMNLRKVFDDLKGPRIGRQMNETGGDLFEVFKNARRNSKGRLAPIKEGDQEMIGRLVDKNTTFMGQYTPSQLHALRKEMMPDDTDLAKDVFYQISKDMKRILEKPTHTSDVATRDVWHTLGNNLNTLPSVMPGVGSFLASKGFQNFLMGNTTFQRWMQKALEKGNSKRFTALVQHAERAIAAQPAIDDEKNDFGNALKGYGNAAREALIGLGE